MAFFTESVKNTIKPINCVLQPQRTGINLYHQSSKKMGKQKIPVYDICSLSKNHFQPSDLLVERFGEYLKRHSPDLHKAHRHSFYHLVLFTKGSGTHTIDFTRFDVKPFEIYFMAPGQVHSWHFESETDGYIINFSESIFRSFLLNPDYLERFSFFNGIGEEGVCHLPTNVHDKVLQLLEDILKATTSEGEYQPDLVRLLLLHLFITVEEVCNKKPARPVQVQQQMLLKNFRRLIDQHYKSLKLPKEYASLLYITPNHLNAITQDLLGKTAGDLIRQRIILEAKRLLINAGLTVTEIAFALNFSDNSYFNRFFKKSEGITPDEFRKQYIQA
ncbi:MAG: helix-turn-helix transcriptional regulator [Chitinophagaceae bacterium]